ncbi:hypothetical protein CYMTET_3568 [Cymbomonas tetramitiformis]|uniref:BTB domain-containing protein n=1 Tax=Cymbomonas tetramitiformis TaxID=36881 RepID=A0AAE0LKQ2_9CHLO|nr:hypothetical protein CYMTET_3568 [Cymbomonas tetramitiformis]
MNLDLERVPEDSTLIDNQLQDGDILVFEKKAPGKSASEHFREHRESYRCMETWESAAIETVSAYPTVQCRRELARRGLDVSVAGANLAATWENHLEAGCQEDVATYLESHCILSPSFSDVEVHIGDRVFPAHKIFLARSPFFRAMLKDGFRESAARDIHIKDVAPCAFDHVLRFLYTDAIELPEGTDDEGSSVLMHVHAAAKRFNIPLLEHECESKMLMSLMPNNLIPRLRHAKMFSLNTMKTACFDLASQSLSFMLELMRLNSFTELVKEDHMLFTELVEACAVNMAVHE